MSKHSKKSKLWILILTIIFLAIVLGIMIVGDFIAGKFSNINIKEIDKEQLAINDDLYNQVSDSLTENEYNNIKTLVLFGIDTQGEGDGQEYEDFLGRSDSIIVVAIDSNKKNIKMISIPRDTYVEIEGHGKTKINSAYAWGEAQLAVQTINQNFGLNLTEYITVDFAGLIQVINEIGGIEVKISYEEMENINRFSQKAYDISGNKRNVLTRYGTILLDGEQALTHSRDRKVGDDFTRAGRQRQVLEAIANKMSQMDAGKISNFLDLFLKEVTTNINISEYMGILSDVLLNKSTYLNNIISAQVPTREYAKDTYIKGIYYFVPDNPEDLKEKMLDYLYRK